MDTVLDPSVALAWGLPDESSAMADVFFQGLTDVDALWVPALWWYEMANALTTAQRRGRIRQADVRRLVELYGLLPILTDPLLGKDALWRFHAMAQESGLSAYDAAYLELAQRKHLSLATLDRGLAQAASARGVQVVVGGTEGRDPDQ